MEVRRANSELVPGAGNPRARMRVQGLEHGALHVPVKVVGLEVERVVVGEQAREAVGDLLAILLRNAYVDAHLH